MIAKFYAAAMIQHQNLDAWVNHPSVESLKAMGFKVMHSVIMLEGGSMYRVAITKELANNFDRIYGFQRAEKMMDDCDAFGRELCNHEYEPVKYMEANGYIYQINECIHCRHAVKVSV